MSILVVLTVLIYFFAPVLKSKIDEAVTKNSLNLNFTVKKIKIFDNDRVSKEEILKVANIKIGDQILDKQIYQIKSDIEKLPWVQNVRVQRILPNTLSIILNENKPKAVLNIGNSDYLINEKGEKLEKLKNKNLKEQYIEIKGKGASGKFNVALDEIYNYRLLYDNLKSMEYIGERRWDVKLKNGSVLKLPEDNIDASLKFLENLELIDKITFKAFQIDLRFTPEKIYVKLIKS